MIDTEEIDQLVMQQFDYSQTHANILYRLDSRGKVLPMCLLPLLKQRIIH